jgi:hypothetical protein
MNRDDHRQSTARLLGEARKLVDDVETQLAGLRGRAHPELIADLEASVTAIRKSLSAARRTEGR